MKVKILGKKTNPFSKGLFSFNEGGSKSGYGANFGNKLTFFNTGDSHLVNPHEGILVGKDLQGTPNLVEDGELIWNGRKKVKGEETYNPYVFSDRLMPSAFMIKGVGGPIHKRNKDLDDHINKTIKVKRGQGGDTGKPGDKKILEQKNNNPNWQDMRENFFAYLEKYGVDDEDKEQMFEDLLQRTQKAEGGVEEPEEDDLILQYINGLVGLEEVPEDELNMEELPQEELPQEETLDESQDEEKTEEEVNDELNKRIEELEKLVADLLELIANKDLELIPEETEQQMSEELVPEEEEELPQDEELMNFAAEGDEFDNLDDETLTMRDIIKLVDDDYNINRTVSENTIYKIDNIVKQLKLSPKNRLKIMQYIQQRMQQLYKKGGEVDSRINSSVKEGYDRLSSAGKAVFRMIQNSKGNPDLREAIMQLYNKLTLEDQLILMPLLLNLAKNGGLFAEGEEMSPELNPEMEQVPLEEQQAQLELQNGENKDLEILQQIQDILTQILENPEVLQDQKAMQLIAEQIKQLAQGLSQEGLLLLQSMMQEFAQALQLGQQQQQDPTQLLGGDPNIQKLRLDVPTAMQLKLMDEQEALQQAQLQLMLLQLMQLQAQGLMKEGGNMYAEDGLMQPLISPLDLLIFQLIQLLAQSGDPNAEQLIQQLALLLSPEGLQYLLLLIQQQAQASGLLEGVQLEPQLEPQLDLLDVINQILDQAFENIREKGEEPTRYNKSEKGGKSFADVVKDISKEYLERPNDPISKRTLDSLMQDLADEQEEIRAMKHKELLDSAFKNMNPQELDLFKKGIALLIQEALGLQLEAPQLLQQQEIPLEQELEVPLEPLQQGQELSPEDKRIVDLVIQLQGIDPSSLSPEEYIEAALLILQTVREQLGPSMDELMQLQGLTSEGGKFAMGGAVNKFGEAGEKKSDFQQRKDLLAAENKALQNRYNLLYNQIMRIDENEWYTKHNLSKEAYLKALKNKLVLEFNSKASAGARPSIKDKDMKSYGEAAIKNLDAQEHDKKQTILIDATERAKINLERRLAKMPENPGITSLYGKVRTADEDDALYNIADVFKLLGIDVDGDRKAVNLIVRDLNKVLGKADWDKNLQNGITKKLRDQLIAYYTTDDSYVGKKIKRDYSNIEDPKGNFVNLERDIRKVESGQLFSSPDGTLLFIKGEDGKGYAVTDKKGNIKYESFKKAGLSEEDVLSTVNLMKENLYRESGSLADYKKYGSNLNRYKFLTETLPDRALKLTDGKWDHVANQAKSDYYSIDDDGNITKKNGKNATDDDKNVNLFGKPIDGDFESDDRPERFKTLNEEEGLKEIEKLYQDRLKTFFNSDKYRKETVVNGKNIFQRNQAGELKNLYLTGAEAREFMNLLKNSDNKEDQFLYRVLNANWGDGKDENTWNKDKTWGFNTKDKRYHKAKDKSMNESEAYIRQAAKAAGILDWDTADIEVLRNNERIKLQADRLWGIEHIPYLAALKRSKYHKVYEILDKDGKGTKLYIPFTDDLPKGFEVDKNYKSDDLTYKGNKVDVIGVIPSQTNYLFKFNGKLYSVTPEEAQLLGLRDYTPVDKDGKSEFEFNDPTDHTRRTYKYFDLDETAPEPKDPPKEKPNVTKAISDGLYNGLGMAGAIMGLFPSNRIYPIGVPEQQVYNMYNNTNEFFPLLVTPDFINQRNEDNALAANVNNHLANLGLSSGATGALMTNNMSSAIAAHGTKEAELIKNLLDRRNLIALFLSKQAYDNNQLDAATSLHNTQAYNQAALNHANNRYQAGLNLLELNYKTDKDNDTSFSEALTTLANIGSAYGKDRDGRALYNTMIANGYIPAALGGRIRTTPRRGWSYF